MDSESYDILTLMGLPELVLITLEDFEKEDKSLLEAKHNRSRIEYYFTCTPSLILYILNNNAYVNLITYLDADLFFFTDPSPIYDEISNHSIGIIEHRYSSDLQDRLIFGKYNVGWLSFKGDHEGLKCLNWWREQCLQWCYDRVEGNKFADQKYLDDWPNRFQKVIVLTHKGANLAPWNLDRYSIYSKGGKIWADEQPIIFYHFHNLRQITSWIYDTNLRHYKTKLSSIVKSNIYAPYVLSLIETHKQFSRIYKQSSFEGTANKKVVQQITIRNRTEGVFRRMAQFCRNFLSGDYIFFIN